MREKTRYGLVFGDFRISGWQDEELSGWWQCSNVVCLSFIPLNFVL